MSKLDFRLPDMESQIRKLQAELNTCKASLAKYQSTTPAPTTSLVSANCDRQYEVPMGGHCYYLDGSGGKCDHGYNLAPESSLQTLASQFAGLKYKHTAPDNNCCIWTSDFNQNGESYGIAGCASLQRFQTIGFHVEGCQTSRSVDPKQPTLCMSKLDFRLPDMESQLRELQAELSTCKASLAKYQSTTPAPTKPATTLSTTPAPTSPATTPAPVNIQCKIAQDKLQFARDLRSSISQCKNAQDKVHLAKEMVKFNCATGAPSGQSETKNHDLPMTFAFFCGICGALIGSLLTMALLSRGRALPSVSRRPLLPSVE
jgi:hypothetical protein